MKAEDKVDGQPIAVAPAAPAVAGVTTGVAEPPPLAPGAAPKGATFADVYTQIRDSDLLSARSSRVAGLVLIALLLGGVAWYYLRESRRAASRSWVELTQTSDYAEFARAHAGTTPGKVAELAYARELIGPEGLAKFRVAAREERAKGVANVAKARDEFARLAKAFEGDKTLRVSCIAGEAEAELALVGVPAEGKPGSRGDLARAAQLYTSASEAAGPATPAGTAYAARAKQLADNKPALEEAAREMAAHYERLSLPVTVPSFPGNPGPIAPPLPPEGPYSPEFFRQFDPKTPPPLPTLPTPTVAPSPPPISVPPTPTTGRTPDPAPPTLPPGTPPITVPTGK